MSAVIAREHAEWLSLIDISGPFLSVEVLTNALPQGLPPRDTDATANLRAAYEEWSDEQLRARPDRSIHDAWVNYVLGTTLELTDRVIARGQAIPSNLQFSVPEYGETIRPDFIIHNPDKPAEPRMLVQVYPPGQNSRDRGQGRALESQPGAAYARTAAPDGYAPWAGDQWRSVDAGQRQAQRNHRLHHLGSRPLDARAALPALLPHPLQRLSLLHARGPAARNLAR